MSYQGNMRLMVALLPLILGYGIVFYVGYQEEFRKDEIRYVYYADNLLNGYYSPPESVFLWNGPGYPLLLAPFVYLGLSFFILRSLNIIFLFLAVFFFAKSLTPFLSFKNILIASIALGFYWPMWGELSLLMSETFTIFLISLLVYTSSIYLLQRKYFTFGAIGSGLVLGFLALTKVIFGYVIIVLIIFLGVLVLFRPLKEIRRILIILALAFLTNIPYLIYTYNLTNIPFYWANSGGMSLYWMSIKHEGEYGNWYGHVNKISRFDTLNSLFTHRHRAVFNEAFQDPPFFKKENFEDLILRLGVEQDSIFKRYALHNILENPEHFMKNWVANISRMLFDIPYSYRMQSMGFLKYLLPNVILVLLVLLVFGTLTISSSKVSTPIWFLALLVMVYLFCSSLLSAYPRQFYVAAPILFYLVTYTIANLLYIKIKLKV